MKNALNASVDISTKIIDNTTFYILFREICYAFFKNIYCFVRFSNTSFSFRLILIKRVRPMFLAPVPTCMVVYADVNF